MARWQRRVMSSLLFGWLLVPQGGRADEAEAAKAIQDKLGGAFTFDDKRPGKPVVGANFTGDPITDAVFGGIEGVPQPRDPGNMRHQGHGRRPEETARLQEPEIVGPRANSGHGCRAERTEGTQELGVTGA